MATPPGKLEQLAVQLKKLSEILAGEEPSKLPANRAKRIRATISEAYEKLRKVVENLDPIKHPDLVFDPYNPLDKKNLGSGLADALLANPATPLSSVKSFMGAGIYAIYYVGDYGPYKLIADRNAGEKFNAPIYVGKADPKGSRKGGSGLDSPGKALYVRLRKHSNTISEVASWKIGDFYCRYLIVDDIWNSVGESILIQRYKPLWNTCIDGFGNNPTGGPRSRQQRSAWDTLHPGRSSAEKLPLNKKSVADLLKEVESFLRTQFEP